MFKVDYDGDKFIHAPTYTYKEVMWLLEFACVVYVTDMFNLAMRSTSW